VGSVNDPIFMIAFMSLVDTSGPDSRPSMTHVGSSKANEPIPRPSATRSSAPSKTTSCSLASPWLVTLSSSSWSDRLPSSEASDPGSVLLE